MAAAGSGGAEAGASQVMGTGKDCQSYTEPANGMCGGWYCGVDQMTLQQAVDASAKCGGDVALLCSNAIALKVGSCARTIKAQMFNATNDQLRPYIRSCVFEDMTIKNGTTPDCLDCFINVAACASDHCLSQCLSGDSAQCDTCRRSAGCDTMLFSCGGLPAPIE